MFDVCATQTSVAAPFFDELKILPASPRKALTRRPTTTPGATALTRMLSGELDATLDKKAIPAHTPRLCQRSTPRGEAGRSVARHRRSRRPMVGRNRFSFDQSVRVAWPAGPWRRFMFESAQSKRCSLHTR